MAITLQGNWTVQVRSRSAACAQRFSIEGADVGAGWYDGTVGLRLHVRGAQWLLRVQHAHRQAGWRESTLRLGLPIVEAGVLRVQIRSAEGPHEDADDLVLECAMPISRSEHVVYGDVSRHDTASPFNPRRDDYLVIDAPVDVPDVCARHPALQPVIAKLYPQRLRMAALGDISPLVLPTGLPAAAVGLRFDSVLDHADGCGDDLEGAVRVLQASAGRVPFRAHAMEAGATMLTRSEFGAIARIREQLVRRACEATPAPAMTLRFERYHRSVSEAAGGTYRGTGLRVALGQTMTDAQGRYLFRFRERPVEAAPDLIVQVAAQEGTPRFETAPYDRVANLRRIDVCVPQRAWGPVGMAPRLHALPVPAWAPVSTQEKRAAEAALCRRCCP